MQNDNRNFIIFIVITFVLLLAYEQFVLGPMEKRQKALQAQAHAEEVAQKKAAAAAPGAPLVAPHVSRAAALAATPHVAVATPELKGSISLAGAKLDDLFLTNYRQTLAAGSPPVELLRPLGAQDSYFAVAGWVGGGVTGLPDETTPWTDETPGALTPTHPLELSYASPSGLVFHRQIAVDSQYLFTVTDRVTNGGKAAVDIAPYGAVQRRGVPPELGKQFMEGAIGMFDRVLKEVRYPKWKKEGSETHASTGGWLGITDKYWMTVFIPPQSEAVHARFHVTPVDGVEDYEASYVGAPRVLAPGATTTETTHIFAGAKVVPVLAGYSKALGAPRLEDAVEWGWFSIITKPLFMLLEFLKGVVGSFALAILALTVIIRGVFFPLYGASYKMSTKMKKIQPEIKALQAKHKGDPAGQQKEMMALYQREKINPITGCVPALLPIPVLIALVNLFEYTIEMRQAPFFGWIRDMSAPDPTTIWNLFGLIPWDPGTLPLLGGLLVGGGLLHIGAWPAIYAFTLWLSMSMAPQTAGIDPTQQKIMQFTPLVFTVFMAHYAAGLVIYYSWSSVFTIVQSYLMMRRFKVENPIDSFLSRIVARRRKAAG